MAGEEEVRRPPRADFDGILRYSNTVHCRWCAALIEDDALSRQIHSNFHVQIGWPKDTPEFVKPKER